MTSDWGCPCGGLWRRFPVKRLAVTRCFALCLLAGILIGCWSGTATAQAQAYPNKLVRFIVPYPPGGGGDLLGRLFADRLSKMWGQPVVVESKPGASTIIGTDFVAKAAPDGYTLLLTSDTSITVNPHLYPKLPYEPLRDLAPITQLIGTNMVLVVHPSILVNTMAELVALAKAQPGRLNYGSSSVGGPAHLSFEALKTEAGINIAHVPYKGLGPAVMATVAGEVQMTLASAATAVGQIHSGKLKALAITRADRSPLMPELPTLKDSGFPNIEPRVWFGLFAPGATPPAIVRKIQGDIAQIISDPDFREREINHRGYTAGGSTPEEFAAFIREDFEFKGRLIRTIGIKAE